MPLTPPQRALLEQLLNDAEAAEQAALAAANSAADENKQRRAEANKAHNDAAAVKRLLERYE